MQTYVTDIAWGDISRHLRKNGVRVAPRACCPGCGDMSKIKWDPKTTDHVFVNTDQYRRFMADSWKRNSTDTLWINWGGNGWKIVALLRQLDLDVEWDGSDMTRIKATRSKQGV